MIMIASLMFYLSCDILLVRITVTLPNTRFDSMYFNLNRKGKKRRGSLLCVLSVDCIYCGMVYAQSSCR